jgi:hypothetical protein
MNWSDQETLKALSQRGKPGPRLVRGLIWAIFAIFLISLLAFLAGIAIDPGPIGF